MARVARECSQTQAVAFDMGGTTAKASLLEGGEYSRSQDYQVGGGIINGSRIFAPQMIARGKAGLIINTGSKQGITTPPGDPAYNVSKAGVKALSEALALELASDNILVNTIAPGPIVAPPDTTVEERQRVEAATPLGRWGGELEIARSVLSLVESDFITGETLEVNGGQLMR